MGLETYRKKRQFNVTSEPRGHKRRGGGNRYVIQKHDATRLHYDLRLELDGVMKSWAVTRGPSLDPNDKRLAVHVEDHPIEYNSFEGTIPEGEYGGGTVMIWDRGRWTPEGDPHKGFAKGHLEFTLHGEKLRGRWHLVRMRTRQGDRHENWLLIKGKDDEARSGRRADILEEQPLSAATGRSMDEIAAGKGKKRVWHSNRADSAPKKTGRPQSQLEFKAQLRAAAASRAKPAGQSATRPKTAKPAAKQRARAKTAAVKVERRSEKGLRDGKAGLPAFVPPSLATLHDGAPSGKNWLHEVKFDGYRIEARLDHGRVQLLTRKQLDWTHRFKPIAEAVRALDADTVLIDGELVVEDAQGVSSFSLLQTDLKEGRSDRFVYRAFDLLYLDGRDLTGAPLTERKAALHRLLKGESRQGLIRYVEHFDEDGPLIFKHACEMNLEGIVSKLRDAPYRSGRSSNFVKIKCQNEQEFVVAGFSPSTAMPKAVGALIVAFHEHGKLRYAGRVGTGYTRATARDLWKRLDPLHSDRPPVALPPDERRKDVVWVKPQVVIEAEFRGITHDGLLRQASYNGLREDKPAREVVRETAAPAAMARRQAARKSSRPVAKAKPAGADKTSDRKSTEIAHVHLTHPDRVYWADVGVTKEDLATYYVRMWDLMAPHVVGRPLAVLRCPEGTAGECFFQKHIAANIKQSSLRHVVKAKEHDVIAVENLNELIELVQSGALEIHVRGSRLDSLEGCDRIVFDLDPGEGVAWEAIVAGAKEIRDRLTELKLRSFAKLSGGKGIHVVLPIDSADWDTTKAFTAQIAAAMAADTPQLYLAKMTKALRAGRIFIDYLRNTREATSVAAYSTRARAGAPVSMPVSWEALSRTTGGNQFTLPEQKKFPAKDAWADIGKVRQKLPETSKTRR
ncbi:MAG TPA: DNA ligase D [Xanthobacteraceae bacterium]|nr:DNA ligase D [Xanthobacteraceae bacterium]